MFIVYTYMCCVRWLPWFTANLTHCLFFDEKWPAVYFILAFKYLTPANCNLIQSFLQIFFFLHNFHRKFQNHNSAPGAFFKLVYHDFSTLCRQYGPIQNKKLIYTHNFPNKETNYFLAKFLSNAALVLCMLCMLLLIRSSTELLAGNFIVLK